MTDWLTNFNWHDGFGDGRFLWIEWHFWKGVGWLGNAVFFSRFLVQWYTTEKLKRVVVPAAFWWLSLAGSLLLLAFALHERSSVFIFAYAFTWIPYIRNLVIQRRHEQAHLDCASCGTVCPPQSKFCLACGVKLTASKAKTSG